MIRGRGRPRPRTRDILRHARVAAERAAARLRSRPLFTTTRWLLGVLALAWCALLLGSAVAQPESDSGSPPAAEEAEAAEPVELIRDGKTDLPLELSSVLLEGLAAEARLDLSSLTGGTPDPDVTIVLSARDASGRPVRLASAPSRLGDDDVTIPFVVAEGLERRIDVTVSVLQGERTIAVASESRTVHSSLWAFLPPLLAISLALALRQVIPALVIGILAGVFIRTGFLITAPLRLLDHDLVRALADEDHLKIVLFTLLLGGMVGVIGKSGGAAGLVAVVSRWARSRRTGQLSGWLAGMVVFFDDYANTLIVGPSLRPLTDRLRVSREKLAFIVDATAAPIASVALISTWIGYEVGLIGDAIAGTSLAGEDAYAVFLASLPFRFYAWLMLGFVFLVALTGRDFGPMRSAENRASYGDVLRPGSKPLGQTDLVDEQRAAPAPAAYWLSLGPIVLMTLVTAAALWSSGRSALAEAGDRWGTESAWSVVFSLRGLGAVLGEAASFDALLYGAGAGALMALGSAYIYRRLNVAAGTDAFTDGIRAMMLAMIILTLAWMIGGVCGDLDTAGAAIRLVGEGLPVRLLPALTFLLAGAISFATGTSWSTMAVLFPVAIPLTDRLALSAGWTPEETAGLLVAVTGSVLTGAVFGDHCSPISDTTVLSSVASGCDHIDHVRTQLPYALTVGGVSLLVGDLAVGFGAPSWVAILLGLLLLVALLVVLGRTTRVPDDAPQHLYGD